MKEEIKDYIRSVSQGDSVESQEKFDNIVNQKVLTALDSLRVDVAHDMFNQPVVDQE